VGLLKTLWTCETELDQIQAGSNEKLVQNINVMMDGFRSLDAAAQPILLHVPRKVVEHVDKGYDPDYFTQRDLEEARKYNDRMRGRLFSAQVLHDQFLARLQCWDEKMHPSEQS